MTGSSGQAPGIPNGLLEFWRRFDAREPSIVGEAHENWLLGASDGVRILGYAPSADVLFGSPPSLMQGQNGSHRYIWVINNAGIPFIEEIPIPTLNSRLPKHTNLTGGEPAYAGGELWFDSAMNEITKVFGPVMATDRKAAARESARKFVRSNFQIGPLYEGRNPTGHIMTAWEAYQSYGFDILDEAVEYSSAILLESVGVVERTFKTRRNDLGLSIESVARAAGVEAGVVKQAEELAHDIPVKPLEKLAFALGLDERLLAFNEKDIGDKNLAFRLKTLQKSSAGSLPLSPGTVLLFAEAASVIRTQSMLMDWLGQPKEANTFQPDPDYGSLMSPAWRLGYRLASDARDRLGLGNTPIRSMRDLVEKRLGIPVLQAQLPSAVAGATITTRGHDGASVRGIVLNTVGDNSKVWVRRATLAHELGHILYDPDTELERLRVDSYTGIQDNPENVGELDYVEQRANAFAIAFLAPLESVRDITPAPIKVEAIGEVMQTFGISRTAAQYHVFNAHYRESSLPEWPEQLDLSDEWLIAEDLTLDYFPVDSVPLQRRGRFAGLVAECHQRRMLSSQTAALYLGCDEQDFMDNADSIRDLHPIENV